MKIRSRILLTSLVFLLISFVGCGQAGSMIVTGTVTDCETGDLVENLEVRLYTYEENLSPTVFPGKDEIASTRTNDQGKYQFEVMVGKYDKVVIQLESGQWAPVEVKEGLIEINLQKGAPLPCH